MWKESLNLSDFKYIEKLTLENGMKVSPAIHSYFLTDLTIPNTVTFLNTIYTPNIKEITIPNSVTDVKMSADLGAFTSWNNTQTINVDNTQEATAKWGTNWSGNATVNYLR